MHRPAAAEQGQPAVSRPRLSSEVLEFLAAVGHVAWHCSICPCSGAALDLAAPPGCRHATHNSNCAAKPELSAHAGPPEGDRVAAAPSTFPWLSPLNIL